ncbi:hypothetical protein Pla110_11500 [Polystyrenella longa]|uniref:Glycosyltransferase RgtA/B/C/D-like domain-containing protein n=1 Tax=Polystyrenella longa TaxID=2528007 RepID=A0A518CJP4_9PLAN|nr:hypothetical protein [Polystyrenella longa]QDU79440.1 hypothetical protein Pla110_11500 [Polystyrenella longa]
MSLVTDQELIQLAADRPEPVLTILKQAEAFKPLLFVLALIPGLLVIQYDELTRYDSLFILQSLEHWEAPSSVAFSLPHWMTGFTLHLTELPISWRSLLPTYFFGVMLVLVVFMLTQTMLNSRCGLIASLLLLMHPQYLEQLTHQVTPMCALALIITSLWGYQRHLLQKTIFSPYLLVGAVAGGLNMFIAPAFTYFLVAWMVADTMLIAALRSVVPQPKGSRNPKEIGMWHSLRFRLISLGGFAAIITASGLFLFSVRWGSPDDFALLMPKLSPVSWEEQRLVTDFLESTSFLLGFLLIGLIVCLKAFLQFGRLAINQRFWVIGFLLSGLVWVASNQTQSDHYPDLVAGWNLLFTITLLVLVAVSLDKILERQVSIIDVMIAFGLALLMAIWYTLRVLESVSVWVQVGVTLFILIALWKIWLRTSGHEFRARKMLRLGVFLLLIMCLGNSVLSRENHKFFAENVAEFEHGIDEVVGKADRFFVISEQDLQPTVRAVLKMQWMNRPLEHYRNWNEAVNKLKEANQSDPPSVLVVNTESLLAPDLGSSLPGWTLQSLGNEYYLQHYILSCYVANHD